MCTSNIGFFTVYQSLTEIGLTKVSIIEVNLSTVKEFCFLFNLVKNLSFISFKFYEFITI
jgi:hypothetical protein